MDCENEDPVVTLHFRSSSQLVEDYPDVTPEQWWEFPKIDGEGNLQTEFSADDIGEWSSEDLGIPLEQHPLIIDVFQELARLSDPIEMCFLWEAVPDGNDPVKPIPDLSAYPALQNAVNALLAPGTALSGDKKKYTFFFTHQKKRIVKDLSPPASTVQGDISKKKKINMYRKQIKSFLFFSSKKNLNFVRTANSDSSMRKNGQTTRLPTQLPHTDQSFALG